MLLQVTDKLGIQLAKRCCRLIELSLHGCPNITAVTVVAFCEHLTATSSAEDEANPAERPFPLAMDLRGTGFDSIEVKELLELDKFPSTFPVGQKFA